MKTSNIIIAIGIIVLVAIFFVFQSKNESQKKHNWQQSYKVTPKYEPYEKGLLYKSLKAELGKQFEDISGSRLLKSSLDNAPEQSVYFCVKKGVYLDSSEIESIMAFLDKGNQVFIAAEIIPDRVINKFLGLEIGEEIDKTYPINVDYQDDKANEKKYWDEYYSPKFPFHNANGWASTRQKSYMNSYNSTESHLFLSNYGDSVQLNPKTTSGFSLDKNWRFFDAKTFRRMSEKHQINQVKPLAYMRKYMDYSRSYASCLEIKVGKGKAVLMSSPIILTNFFLKDSTSYQYVSNILTELNAKQLYWDNQTRENLSKQSVSGSESYYRVLLNNPNLSKAFYIFLLVSFVYILLSIKRKQRAIPISEPNDNTSLEYTNTIARLYYLNPNHKLILNKKRQYFQNFINKRYSLLSQDDEEFQEILSKKSGIELKYIHKLYNSYKLADTQSEVKEYLLMQVADLQQHFYSNCK